MLNALIGSCSWISRPNRVVPNRVASTLYCPTALSATRSMLSPGSLATALNGMLTPVLSATLPWISTEAGSSSSASMTNESLAPISPEGGARL
ncbi:hypothetical protein D3C76_1190380 [compost metagenome]